MYPVAPRSLWLVTAALLAALTSGVFAGDAENFLVRLMSGEAQSDGPWLAYELKAREGDVRVLKEILDQSKRFGAPPGEIRAHEMALEHAKARTQILEAKQKGNAPKLTLLIALTDYLEKGKAVDTKALAEPTKIFMRSRVSEADARLAVVKVDQTYKDAMYRRAKSLFDRGAIEQTALDKATDDLKVANTLVTEAEAAVKLARQVYEDVVKEKP